MEFLSLGQNNMKQTQFLKSAYQQQQNYQVTTERGFKMYCEEHSNEIITNFCSVLDCLKPLCPDCIDYHNRFHKVNQTYPEIDSLKNVKINCSKKVKAAILSLSQQLERLEFKYFNNPQEVIEDGLMLLKRAKERIFSMIDVYFDNLENNYRRKVIEISQRGSDFNIIFENVQKIISEMEYLQMNLDSSNQLNMIKKICLLDLKSLIEKAKFDINTMIEGKIHTFDIIVNDSRLVQIESELAKYVNMNPVTHVQLNAIVTNNPSLSQRSPTQNNNNNSFQQSQNNFFFNNNNNNNSTVQTFNLNSNLSPKVDNINRGQLDMSFQITQPDYFEQNCPHKYLHFFPNNKKLLYLFDLEKQRQDSQIQYQKLDLDIDFNIPEFHKSIILPNGDIYLTGGCSSDGDQGRLNKVYILNYKNIQLIQKQNMLTARSSHGICYMNGQIYVVGGFQQGKVYTSKCERYNIQQNVWNNIASLNHNVISPTLCTFNNKYIFKIGGLIDGKNLNNYIERYDPYHNIWTVIDARFDTTEPQKLHLSKFKLLSNSASVQINKQEILIFGGYDQNNEASNQCFILYQNENNYLNQSQTSGDEYIIKKINYKPLPFAEGFWNNDSIIQYKQLFAQQNIPNERNDNCLPYNRRILIFNSFEWTSLDT